MDSLVPANRTSALVAAYPHKGIEGDDILVVLLRRAFLVHANGRLEDVSKKSVFDLADTYHGEEGISSIRRPSMLFPEKPGTDVILLGHAHAPSDESTQVDVTLDVGPVKKTVRAFGLRTWRRGGLRGASPGPALAIREPVPLQYELAYGGQDLSDPARPIGEQRNYVGRGVSRDISSLVDQPAHQLEYARESSHPAAFGPIHRHWLPRLRYAGTHDDAWFATRMPLLPRDFDPKFNSCVPEDQWCERPLRGDERITVTNATADGLLTAQLPRFAHGFASIVHGVREDHPTHLDTILVDADARTIELTWRAVVTLPRKWEMVERIMVYDKQVV